MLPLTPTHALALARSEELQRRAEGARLAAAAPTRHGRIGSTLLAVAHDARRELALTTEALTGRPLSARGDSGEAVPAGGRPGVATSRAPSTSSTALCCA